MESINTLRSLLVAGAVFSALIAALYGRWTVVLIFALGVAAHAALWVHLGRTKADRATLGTAPTPGSDPSP